MIWFSITQPARTETTDSRLRIRDATVGSRFLCPMINSERTAQWKMSDHGQFFVLHSETVHPVPVGTDVSK